MINSLYASVIRYFKSKKHEKELYSFFQKYKLEDMSKDNMFKKVVEIADKKNSYPNHDYFVASNFLYGIICFNNNEEDLDLLSVILFSNDENKITNLDISDFKKKYLDIYPTQNELKLRIKKLEEISNINSNYSNNEKQIAQRLLNITKDIKE